MCSSPAFMTSGGRPNAVPVANVSTPAGAQFNDVTLQYFLTDAEGEPTDLQVAYEWSTDGGLNWSPSVTATESTAGGSDGITNLAASPTGTGVS